jgi:uncharacterized protein
MQPEQMRTVTRTVILMNVLGAVWRRTPVMIRAILIGLTVAAAGTVPWAALAGVILRSPHSPPWEVVLMSLYLVVFWRYLNGWGWPKSTSIFRRERLRARPLSSDMWASAVGVGVVALTIVVGLQSLFSQFVHVPAAPGPPLSSYPWFTVLPALVMGGAVAGIVEEAGFRGYMQSMIERSHGPVIAIGVVSFIFAAAHFGHGLAQTLPRLPFYFAIGVIYGVLTYRTGSILPALVIHAAGDVLDSLTAWATSN